MLHLCKFPSRRADWVKISRAVAIRSVDDLDTLGQGIGIENDN